MTGKKFKKIDIAPKKIDLMGEYLERQKLDVLGASVTNLCIEMTEVREILKKVEKGDVKGSDIQDLQMGLDFLKKLKKAGVKQIHF